MNRRILLSICLVVVLVSSCELYAYGAYFNAPVPTSGVGSSVSQSGRTLNENAVPVPEPTEKALRYYRTGIILWLINISWGLLIPALFLFTGLSARVRDWAKTLGHKWFFVVALYFTIFTLLNFVIDLPLSYYEGFLRQHAYDLSNQTASKWLSDELKSLAVSVTSGCLFVWAPYLLLKKSPRRWWLYTGALALPFIFVVALITPVWIDPLFNDFGPMKDKALETKILALAERAGIEGGRVYEVNKSVDTKTLNAYVNGFLSTKRIVLWDTTIARLDEDELLAIVGHELGHYVLGHVIKGIFFFWALLLAALYLAHRLSLLVMTRFGPRFGFNQLSDIASLPLLLLLINVLSLALSPFGLAFSRHIEHEADRFSLDLTGNNHAAASAFVKLQTDNLSNPRPSTLIKVLRYSHPPMGERIDFCNTYRGKR